MIREIAASIVLGFRHLVLLAMGASGWAETRLLRWAWGIRQGRMMHVLTAYALLLGLLAAATWAVAR